jgi:hypothetical protein
MKKSNWTTNSNGILGTNKMIGDFLKQLHQDFFAMIEPILNFAFTIINKALEALNLCKLFPYKKKIWF